MNSARSFRLPPEFINSDIDIKSSSGDISSAGTSFILYPIIHAHGPIMVHSKIQNLTLRSPRHSVFTELIGPNIKAYWPRRIRDILNLKSSLYSSDVPLRNLTEISQEFSNAVRLLPLSVDQISRENMIEWRKRRSGVKSK